MYGDVVEKNTASSEFIYMVTKVSMRYQWVSGRNQNLTSRRDQEAGLG